MRTFLTYCSKCFREIRRNAVPNPTCAMCQDKDKKLNNKKHYDKRRVQRVH